MTDEAFDVADYCRRIEDYLTRVNSGHLVRIVGPSFELVRQWADERIPLSVVRRGIDRKLERRKAANRMRPLRLEFCEADVREVYDGWRRAIGLTAGPAAPSADDAAGHEPRRPSLAKHLDRVVDRLSRVAGRLDLPETLRDAVGALLPDVASLRDESKHARGPARDDLAAKLRPLDRRLLDSARAAAPASLLEEVHGDAERDLAPFRSRLSEEAWRQALETTANRLLRDRLGLPVIEA